MKKFLYIFLVLFLTTSNVTAHTSHYKNLKKIEMEVFRDGKVIGYNYYFFDKKDETITVKNQIRFKVSLFGVDLLNVEGYGIEKYENDQLISYKSKTLQNDKKKFVDLIYDSEKDKFNIKGSSYSGLASTDNIIGNWWNHRILQASSQISPISGSIKEQVVTFLGKEKIKLYGRLIDVDHFRLTSKDMSTPKDKRLNFDIWYNSKSSMILKISYSRLGYWEYKVKNFR
tara:strand:+ start:202 stop:885 length:684 start_codon:yes stop_codon:yes gene_type:complete